MKKLSSLIQPEAVQTINEGDFGEVDNGLYAGNTTSGAFSSKNTPEKAPVMETDVNEISTGLAQRAQDSAFAKVQQIPKDISPIERTKALNQAETFGAYVNPELITFLKSKNINVDKNSRSDRVVLNLLNDRGDKSQLMVRPDKYEFIYGNAESVKKEMIQILPNIIKRIQADMNTQPDANQLEENSTVHKKIKYRMTENQKKMYDELKALQENIQKITGNKKLLY